MEWERTGAGRWTRYGWRNVWWVEWRSDHGDNLWCLNMVHPEKEWTIS